MTQIGWWRRDFAYRVGIDIKLNISQLYNKCLDQRYSEGSLLTHLLSNGGRSKHYLSISVISSPRFLFKNADASFVVVYFCPQKQYKICVRIGPFLLFLVLIKHRCKANRTAQYRARWSHWETDQVCTVRKKRFILVPARVLCTRYFWF